MSHGHVELWLVMVIPLSLVVILSSNINNNVALLQHSLVPGSDDLGISVLWQHLQHHTSKNFISVETQVVSPDLLLRKRSFLVVKTKCRHTLYNCNNWSRFINVMSTCKIFDESMWT